MTRVIGIAGGTASGKTTLAAAFATRVGAALIAHDRYYRELERPEEANFDHPDSLDTGLLVEHLNVLRAGGKVTLPRYDFATHRRSPGGDAVAPAPLTVVEGILVLAEPALRACFDLTVFVDTPDDIRLLRRMVRDVRERERSVESVADQYLATVRPMHHAFVVPSARHAAVHLDGTAPIATLVALLEEQCRNWK